MGILLLSGNQRGTYGYMLGWVPGGGKCEFSFLFCFLTPFYLFLSSPFNIGLDQENLTFLVFSPLFLLLELRHTSNLLAVDWTTHQSAHSFYLISFVLLACILFQYSSYYCTALQSISPFRNSCTIRCYFKPHGHYHYYSHFYKYTKKLISKAKVNMVR